MYQCVSAGCDIHVQCCGSVTYVVSWLEVYCSGPGGTVVERRGVKLMFCLGV